MENSGFPAFPVNRVPTPSYLVDEGLLENNLAILDKVQKETGCRILLAVKGFSLYSTFPLIRRVLHGICASSPHEARLGREEFRREVHTFAAAYSPSDIKKILKYSDYILFNSFSQWHFFRDGLPKNKKYGIRLNPEYAEIKTELYNPCAPHSRLGVTWDNFKGQDLKGITGLHFHALCEQNSDTLERVLSVVEGKFSCAFGEMEWFNLGGGHHITRPDYDLGRLIRVVKGFKARYPHLTVYLEPGEAVALNTGVLVASVLDIVHNGMDIAVLDTSAETHMPDVLAMPYRPEILGASKPGEEKHTYRLAGLTCLAGDVIGDYSFREPLNRGDRVIFLDMAHYTMVKNTTFNGINLPSIVVRKKNGEFKVLKKFGYHDFKSRL